MSLVDLLQSLDSEQLRDVAEWLRETASDYDSVGQQPEADCLRSQASKLEILVSELTAPESLSPESLSLESLPPESLPPESLSPEQVTSQQTASPLQDACQQSPEVSASASSPAAVIRRKHRRTDPAQVIKGWLQSREDASELAYLLMGDGATVRQRLGDGGDEVSEPCSSDEMEDAYRSGQFTILAGADYLADYFVREEA